MKKVDVSPFHRQHGHVPRKRRGNRLDKENNSSTRSNTQENTSSDTTDEYQPDTRSDPHSGPTSVPLGGNDGEGKRPVTEGGEGVGEEGIYDVYLSTKVGMMQTVEASLQLKLEIKEAKEKFLQILETYGEYAASNDPCTNCETDEVQTQNGDVHPYVMRNHEADIPLPESSDVSSIQFSTTSESCLTSDNSSNHRNVNGGKYCDKGDSASVKSKASSGRYTESEDNESENDEYWLPKVWPPKHRPLLPTVVSPDARPMEKSMESFNICAPHPSFASEQTSANIIINADNLTQGTSNFQLSQSAFMNELDQYNSVPHSVSLDISNNAHRPTQASKTELQDISHITKYAETTMRHQQSCVDITGIDGLDDTADIPENSTPDKNKNTANSDEPNEEGVQIYRQTLGLRPAPTGGNDSWCTPTQSKCGNFSTESYGSADESTPRINTCVARHITNFEYDSEVTPKVIHGKFADNKYRRRSEIPTRAPSNSFAVDLSPASQRKANSFDATNMQRDKISADDYQIRNAEYIPSDEMSQPTSSENSDVEIIELPRNADPHDNMMVQLSNLTASMLNIQDKESNSSNTGSFGQELSLEASRGSEAHVSSLTTFSSFSGPTPPRHSMESLQISGTTMESSYKESDNSRYSAVIKSTEMLQKQKQRRRSRRLPERAQSRSTIDSTSDIYVPLNSPNSTANNTGANKNTREHIKYNSVSSSIDNILSEQINENVGYTHVLVDGAETSDVDVKYREMLVDGELDTTPLGFKPLGARPPCTVGSEAEPCEISSDSREDEKSDVNLKRKTSQAKFTQPKSPIKSPTQHKKKSKGFIIKLKKLGNNFKSNKAKK